jgi:hypothetical protein
MNPQRTAVLAVSFILLLAAVGLLAGCGAIEQRGIEEIRCLESLPLIVVKPKAASKQAVMLRWEPAENCWYWTWPSAKGWEKTPKDFFELGPLSERESLLGTREEWWIEAGAPKFGHTKAYLGIYAQIKSWRFEGATWKGTGAPPTITLE